MGESSTTSFHLGRPSVSVYSNCRYRNLLCKAKWLEVEEQLMENDGFVEMGPLKILHDRMAAYNKNREIQMANEQPPKDEEDKNAPATRMSKWLAFLVPLFMLVMLEIFSLTEPIRESASTMYNWFLGIDFINNLISWW